MENLTDCVQKVFERMNSEYTGVMRRLTSHGSWRNWDRSAPSVWLTAWCLRVLQAVSFQDWEDFIYIDPQVFGNAVMWLLNYQNAEGAFLESSEVDLPLHYSMRASMTASNSSGHLALTAHVLIALDAAAPLLTGHVKQYCSTARHRALRHVERHVDRVQDTHVMALVTFALAKVSQSHTTTE